MPKRHRRGRRWLRLMLLWLVLVKPVVKSAAKDAVASPLSQVDAKATKAWGSRREISCSIGAKIRGAVEALPTQRSTPPDPTRPAFTSLRRATLPLQGRDKGRA